MSRSMRGGPSVFPLSSGAPRSLPSILSLPSLACGEVAPFARSSTASENDPSSRPQWLAADVAISRLSGGFGNPPGADCGVLIIPQTCGNSLRTSCTHRVAGGRNRSLAFWPEPWYDICTIQGTGPWDRHLGPGSDRGLPLWGEPGTNEDIVPAREES
jgi:hypothetical protein